MDSLTSLSNITGGLQSFGEAGQYMTQASGLKQQAGLLDVFAKANIVAGDQQANQVRIAGDKFIARQRAMYAKAGVKLSGSPAMVWAETERNIQMDVINTKLNAAAKANAIGFEALNARIAAGNARTAAWGKATEGILKIGTAFATSGGGKSGTVGTTGKTQSEILGFNTRQYR